MELKQFHGEIRTDIGKEAARRARNAGRVPGVLYGPGVDEPVAITLDPKDMLPHVIRESEGRLFDLILDGKTIQVFIKEFQVHPIRKNLIHMDLMATKADRLVRAKIPIVLQGPAVGEKLGGRVFKVAYDILVDALPEHFPAAIEIDIREMDSGDVLYVDQLTYPEGVTPIYKARYPVVLVKMPRGQDEEEDEGDEEEGEGEGEEGASEDGDAEAKSDSE